MGQLVYFTDLLKIVKVKDENLQGCVKIHKYEKWSSQESKVAAQIHDHSSYFHVAKYINEFEINQVFDLNSSMYQCRPLTEVRTLIQMDDSSIAESIVNFGKISVAKKAIPNALICWYKIHLTPEHIHSTKRGDSFMNHTAVVLEDDLRDMVLQDRELKFKIYQMNGLVRATLMRF